MHLTMRWRICAMKTAVRWRSMQLIMHWISGHVRRGIMHSHMGRIPMQLHVRWNSMQASMQMLVMRCHVRRQFPMQLLIDMPSHCC